MTFTKRILKPTPKTQIPARIDEEVQSGGQVEISFSFDNLDYLASWLLRFGADVRVMEPADLIERHQAGARAITSNY